MVCGVKIFIGIILDMSNLLNFFKFPLHSSFSVCRLGIIVSAVMTKSGEIDMVVPSYTYIKDRLGS